MVMPRKRGTAPFSSAALICAVPTLVRSPCDEAAILAGPSHTPGAGSGSWLLLAALLLTGGAFGDIYGRRKVFAIGVALFAVASAWCGVAPDIAQLIAARGLQGIGGALLIPGSLALISASFREEERGRAIGTWPGFTAITAAIGPV